MPEAEGFEYRFGSYSRNVNELLQGLEGEFLGALAEHQRQESLDAEALAVANHEAEPPPEVAIPKGIGAHGGADSETTGTTSASAEKVFVSVGADEETASRILDLITRFTVFGDPDSAEVLVYTLAKILTPLIEKGIRERNWFPEDDEGEF